jgi:hypothetical protein
VTRLRGELVCSLDGGAHLLNRVMGPAEDYLRLGMVGGRCEAWLCQPSNSERWGFRAPKAPALRPMPQASL